MDQISREMFLIEEESKKQLRKLVEKIYRDTVQKTPVDSGLLKQSIKRYGVKSEKDGYSIGSQNQTKNYSHSIMIIGRRKINGKYMGSEQLPDGILPHIRQILRTNNIKFKEGDQ